MAERGGRRQMDAPIKFPGLPGLFGLRGVGFGARHFRQDLHVRLCGTTLVHAVAVLLACLVSAPWLMAYSDPPHTLVHAHNLGLAPGLLALRVPAAGERPRDYPLRFASASVLAMDPSVDGQLCSDLPPDVLWGWSYDAQQDFGWNQTLSGCGSTRTRMSFLGVDGRFDLHIRANGNERVLGSVPNPVSVFPSPSQTSTPSASPSNLVPGRASDWSDGSASAELWLRGHLDVRYHAWDEYVRCQSVCSKSGCTVSSWVVQNERDPDYEYVIESVHRNFPVVHPANRTLLLTPWVSNHSLYLPSLDFLAYSNVSWYRALLSEDGRVLSDERMHDFDVVQTPEGAWSVVSLVNRTSWSDPAAPVAFTPFAGSGLLNGYRFLATLLPDASAGLHHWQLQGQDGFGTRYDSSFDLVSHDSARLTLGLSSVFVEPGIALDVSVRLSRRSGAALPVQDVTLEWPGGSARLLTDSDGMAHSRLHLDRPGAYRLLARYDGAQGMAATFADAVVTVRRPVGGPLSGPADAAWVRRYDGLMLGLVLLLGLAMVRLR